MIGWPHLKSTRVVEVAVAGEDRPDHDVVENEGL